MGCEVFFISLKKKIGMESLMSFIVGKESVLSGPSGAGKSTFVNQIFGTELMPTGEVSDRTGKGCHTTSSVHMFAISGGGLMIDTPGIREFGIQGMPKAELALYYHDFDEFRDKCRFMPCTHTHEPHCAVKQACEDGLVDAERYESYINLYESLEEPDHE
jgi:ribosome biogenesis GTPase